MSKILVVEPWKMLQQGIALILIPDHEVRLSAVIPLAEDSLTKEYDILIVDAAALRERDSLSRQGISALQDWGIPTIWIEDQDTGFTPQQGKVIVIKRPVERNAILSAVAACLKMPTAPAQEETVVRGTARKGSSRTRPEKKESKAAAAGAKLIELVDVIEEEPPQEK